MASKNKLAEFKEILSADEINLKQLNKLCFHAGCPDKDGIRSLCWKILLGYLPLKRSIWDDELSRQRSSYRKLMNELIVNPYGSESDHSEIDHPLNPNPESQWHKYFEDNDVLLQIDHDTRRLYPDISFFQLPTQYPRTDFNTGAVLGIEGLKARVDRTSLPSQKMATSRSGVRSMVQSKKSSDDSEPYLALKQGEEAHWEVVERILFIYAKVNRGLQYIQGMNEIIGPIYYLFAQDPDPKWREHAEADTFFCFANLMVEIGQHFTKKLDRSRAGIGGSMYRMMSLLSSADAELHRDVNGKGIDPTFFSFRWITLLLSQEFLLPDVIRIWDSLFSDENRFDFLLYICCAMLTCIRTDIIMSDFSQCIRLLQNYPINDIQRILQKAQDLKRLHPTIPATMPADLS